MNIFEKTYKPGEVAKALRISDATFRAWRDRYPQVQGAFRGHHKYTVEDVCRLAIANALAASGRHLELAFNRALAEFPDEPLRSALADVSAGMRTRELIVAWIAGDYLDPSVEGDWGSSPQYLYLDEVGEKIPVAWDGRDFIPTGFVQTIVQVNIIRACYATLNRLFGFEYFRADGGIAMGRENEA